MERQEAQPLEPLATSGSRYWWIARIPKERPAGVRDIGMSEDWYCTAGRYCNLGVSQVEISRQTASPNPLKGVQGASTVLVLWRVRAAPPGRHFNPGASQVEM